MAENMGLSYIAFMSVIDSMEEIIGVNGKNAILRYTGFEKLIDTPLEYTTEKRMAVEDGHRLYMGIREIIGNKGYNPLMFRGGILRKASGPLPIWKGMRWKSCSNSTPPISTLSG